MKFVQSGFNLKLTKLKINTTIKKLTWEIRSKCPVASGNCVAPSWWAAPLARFPSRGGHLDGHAKLGAGVRSITVAALFLNIIK